MAKGGNKGKPDGGGGGDGGGNDEQISFNGKKKDDLLIGNELDNDMWGRDGNDILYGMGGNDLLVGGDGDDILFGDFGYGDFGFLEPTSDTDVAGDDRLFGGDGNDQLYGGDGNDELQGGDGWDILDGGDGYDIALYSADDYSIYVTVDGSGFNVKFNQVTLGNGELGPLPIDDEKALNIEGIVGTYYDDEMYGADSRDYTLDGYVNVFSGYYGDDIIYGGTGADWLDGGGDDDEIYGLGGDDTLLGGSGNDIITPGTGIDYVDGGSNGWWEAPDHDIVSYEDEDWGLVLTARIVDLFDSDGIKVGEAYAYDATINGETDFLWNVEEVRGTEFDDTMTGLSDGGDDHFVGGGGSDTLDGQGGNDVLEGGAGDDTLTGGEGADTFLYHSASEGGDSITDFSGNEDGSGEGDVIDLSALNLNSGANLDSLITDGFIFIVDEDKLFVDLDGEGTGDDILIATFTDGGGGFTLADDILV